MSSDNSGVTMNNPNFVYPNLDPNFLGVPKDQNQLPVPYQENIGASQHYGTHSYEMPSVDLFPDASLQSVRKEFNEDVGTSLGQVTGNELSAPASGGPVLNLNMEKVDPAIYSLSNESADPLSPNNQEFCSKFSSPTILNNPSISFADGLQPDQHDQFVRNVSQPQEYSHQFGSRQCPSHDNVFLSGSPASINGASVYGQPPLTSINEFSTELNNCIQTAETYPEVNSTSEQNVYSNQTAALHASYSESQIGRQHEFPDMNLAAYTVPSVRDLDTTLSPGSQPHLQFNVGFPFSARQEAVKLTQSYDPSSQSSAQVSVCQEKSLSEVINECPQNNLPTCDTTSEETGSTTAKIDLANDVNSSLSLPAEGAEESNIKLESYNRLHLSSFQSSLDAVPNVFKGQEEHNPSSPRTKHASVSDVDTASASVSNAVENQLEAVLHQKNLSRNVSTDEMDSVNSHGEKGPNGDTAIDEDEKRSDINGPKNCLGSESPTEKSEESVAGSSERIHSELPISKKTAEEDVSKEETSISEDINEPEKHLESESYAGKSGEEDKVSADSSAPIDCEPMSPMITVLNDAFGEETSIPEEGRDPQDGSAEGSQVASGCAVRVTRARTGALPNRTRRLVDEYLSGTCEESSLDSIPDGDWEYEEGAELAPSKVEPFVTVPDKVLQVTSDELDYYSRQFPGGVGAVLKMKLHCTACGKHIGAAPNNIHLGNLHKVLRVLICNKCRGFYGLGKFPRDSDGSEFYCRWCGQGGQIICCSSCPNVFCESCIKRNFGSLELNTISNASDWACYICNYEKLWHLRALCWALLTYTGQKKREALRTNDARKMLELEQDCSKCCGVVKNKKRKTSNKKRHTSVAPANTTLTSHHSEDTYYDENVHFGHFLFDHQSPQMHQDDPTEEDDFIDPSQFVQPVLQEERPRPNPTPSSTVHPQRQPPQGRGHFRPVVPRVQGVQVRPSIVTSTAPRIVIRQGNLMQPGLAPFNKQPNSIGVPGRSTIRNPALNLASASPSRPLLRNPANVLSNVDGVRSMDQLQSLNSVPWFRDGLDNIRAVGFALTKRIRELEARFHSLKNKQDVEKVIKLGKKLERLSSKTESRFKQINSGLRESSKIWYLHKIGCGGSQQAHPFSYINDNSSDWDDDLELSRPLEKVLIPLNSAAIQQNSGMRPIIASSIPPPPLIRTSFTPRLPLQRPAPQTQKILIRPRPSMPGQGDKQIQIRTVFHNNQLTVQPVRLPGPKSSAARYRSVLKSGPPTILNSINVEKVKTLLNQRNGTHNISVSMTSPSKRKRQDSDCSDDSDVVVCPTIPELLAMHNVKPCTVRLEKNDDFIVSFLENQEKWRQQNVNICSTIGIFSDPDGDSEPIFVQDTLLTCDIFPSNASTYCMEPAEEPCNIREDMLDISRHENILPCQNDVADGKEVDIVLPEGNHPATYQVNVAVVDDATIAAADDDIEIINEVS